ncbi:MAG: hypothetical protein MJK18_09830, partial [Bdellovibrionales bacterium]|nr:hypothetical protein [Bdellovibrionales bacterium]
MKIILSVFLFSPSLWASELIYGVQGSDYHDWVKINFTKRTAETNSMSFYKKKPKLPWRMGVFEITDSVAVGRLYKSLPLAMRKATKFRNIFPSHKHYIFYKKKLNTSGSPMFKLIEDQVVALIGTSMKMKSGVILRKVKASYQIKK